MWSRRYLKNESSVVVHARRLVVLYVFTVHNKFLTLQHYSGLRRPETWNRHSCSETMVLESQPFGYDHSMR